MRKIIWSADTPFAGADLEEELEVADDATEDEIEEAVREAFFNHFNYGWREA